MVDALLPLPARHGVEQRLPRLQVGQEETPLAREQVGEEEEGTGGMGRGQGEEEGGGGVKRKVEVSRFDEKLVGGWKA